MKSLFTILSFFLVVHVMAEVNCASRPPRRLPVIDQDGVGTCAAASSALLIQSNVQNDQGQLGLPQTPSYLQMSMYSGARLAEPGFFRTDPKDNSRSFFSAFQNVCDVTNTAMTQGFCDSDKFPLDFVGHEDPDHSQQLSLELIGDYLQSNNSGLALLRERFQQNPLQTQNLLAHLYQNQGRVCQGDPKRMIVRNVWLRRKEAWRAQLARTTDPARRRVLTSLLERTFGANGEPTQAAMDYGRDDLFVRGMGVRDTPDHINTIGEGVLSIHWANRNGLESQWFLGEGITDDAIQADHRRTRYCQWPMLMAMQEFLRNPDCPIPENQTVPSDVRLAVEALGRMFTRQDLRASMVGLMAPACADQAQRRRITNMTCQEVVINQANEVAKKTELISELCEGRAVVLTVCPWFMRLTAAYDSGHCSRPVSGVNTNDYHAFTAIGLRTVGNKRQVMIQNSFGSRCDFASGAGNNPVYANLAECERNADGVTTGRFWIDEDLLFNNSIQMTTLKGTN